MTKDSEFKVAIAGAGYVVLSKAILFAQKHELIELDIVETKVDLNNRKCSIIEDADIGHYIEHKPLNLKAALDKRSAYKGQTMSSLPPPQITILIPIISTLGALSL